MSWQYRNSQTFPKIFTEKSFFFSLAISKKDFNKLATEKSSHYRKERKIKRDGVRFREIYKPDPELKKVLKKINRKYLSKINFPSFVHCGPKGKSIVTACRGHEKFIHHISLDIDSFFDKVSQDVTKHTLTEIGVNKNIVDLIITITVEDNKLPQGFPTSSLLSSLVVSIVLQDFYLVFDKEKILLSMYADDILLSSDDKTLTEQAERYIEKKLNSINLFLNSKKEVSKKGNKFRWLGLQIHPWICLPREDILSLQKKVHTYKNKGIIPSDFKPKRNTDLKKQWKQSIKGKVVFAQSINHNKLLEKISKSI